jgi:hypothetical protein
MRRATGRAPDLNGQGRGHMSKPVYVPTQTDQIRHDLGPKCVRPLRCPHFVKMQKPPTFVGILTHSDLHHIVMTILESNCGTAEGTSHFDLNLILPPIGNKCR